MTRKNCLHRKDGDDTAITSMIEYLSITSILIGMMIIILFVTNAAFVETPSADLKFHHYVDVGNGVSVRIIDLYVIAPNNGTISTKFDLPDEVAGQDYFVELQGTGTGQTIIITDGNRLDTRISIAGIGVTRGVTGQTTGRGINRIFYNSKGV
jgi:hypothetical protein